MTKFSATKRTEQETWRARFLSNQVYGRQNRGEYLHVLPRKEWEQGLWRELRSDGPNALAPYLLKKGITAHTGVHNLCSSWMLCANLYFPFRSADGRQLLGGFLRETLGIDLISCDTVELEYERPEPELKPSVLLGEEGGSRGTGQTSPDLAFEITTEAGQGLILVESKYTEHWFYECSGHKKKSKGREGNPDPMRCDDLKTVLASPATQCHVQQAWSRRYWEHLGPHVDSAGAQVFTGCPAARGAYQLLRQQALAEGLAKSGLFSLVLSAVAYDEANTGLFEIRSSPHTTVDLRIAWPAMFKGRSRFATFTHQQWVRYVARHADTSYADWLLYVKERYGYC